MRPSHFNLLNLELCKECLRKLGPGMGWNPAGATSRCMQSESNSQSGRNWGAAVELDAIREQQPKLAQSGSS